MALSPWGRARCNQSPWDPFWLESCTLDPFEMMAPSPARHFGQTSRVIAGTRVDWLETDRAHIFKADLPGLKKEEINVVLEDERTLQISGERNHEEVRKGDTWHAAERSHGRFLRRFRLPENANTDAVSAKVEDGVLTVTIPKIRFSPCDRRCIMVV